MKQILLFLFTLAINLIGQAQKPEPVYSFAKVSKPVAWYKTQATAWQKEFEKNPKNAAAWYFHYRALRNLIYIDTNDRRSREEKNKDLTKLIARMEKAVPNSYEFNLTKWMNGGNNFKYLPYLKKAMELGEGHTEYLCDVLVWAEGERDLERRNTFARKWFESGDVSPGLLYYNYNVLIGLPKNAIVFTGGDNDTFPAWVLQAQGVRPDVLVLNSYLLHLTDYRKRIFDEIEVDNLDLYEDEDHNLEKEKLEKFEANLILNVAANRKNRPVFVALTATSSEAYIRNISDKLFLTGLAYAFSHEPLDNMALLRKNFEQKYALDYLDKVFYSDISQTMVHHANGNYLIPMLKLYEHYTASGESQRADWIKDKLLTVSKGTDSEAEIKKRVAGN
jgi:hypothetical protein